jgi:hypothetical protein
MKYRKRQPSVEAFREMYVEAFPVKECEVTITSCNGTAIARDGDWIVRGFQGELHPVRDKVFQRTYEEIPD